MKALLEIIKPPAEESFVYKIDHSIWPKWHYHPEYEILLVLRTSGQFIVGDHIGSYRPGDLILVGPNLPHSVHPASRMNAQSAEPCLAVIQFATNQLGNDMFDKPEFGSVRRLLKKMSQGLLFFGDTRKKAAETLKKMGNMRSLQKMAHLFFLLDQLAESDENKILASPTYAPSLNTNSIKRIDKVSRYIMKNLSSRITLGNVSRLVSMSDRSFCRFFKKNTGKTLVQYVNELRVGKACQILTESDTSVLDICYEVGFNNVSNFNRRFLTIKRMTPREYRKKYAKEIA